MSLGFEAWASRLRRRFQLRMRLTVKRGLRGVVLGVSAGLFVGVCIYRLTRMLGIRLRLTVQLGFAA